MEKEPTKEELMVALESIFGNAPVKVEWTRRRNGKVEHISAPKEKETPTSESTPSTV